MLTSELGTAFPAEGGPYVWDAAGVRPLAGRDQLGHLLGVQPDLARRLADDHRGHGLDAFFPRSPACGSGCSRSCSSGRRSGRRSCPSTRASGCRRSAASPASCCSACSSSASSSTPSRTAFTASARRFSPTYAVFIAAVPVLFFNYVGFELPSTAGEEMKNPQRDVPFTILAPGSSRCSCTAGRCSRSCSCSHEPGHEPERLHHRDSVGVHRLGRARRRATERDADGRSARCSATSRRSASSRPAHQRQRLDHGRRPRPGGRLLRRRRPAGLGQISERFGTPVR